MVGDTKLNKKLPIILKYNNLDRYLSDNAYIIRMLHNTLYVKMLYKLSQPEYYFELDTPKDNTKTI